MRVFSVFVLLSTLVFAGCSGSETAPTLLPSAPFSTTDIRVGTGAVAAAGRTVTVNYTLWLYDPSRPENKGNQADGPGSFSLLLGAGQAIRGFEQGVAGMAVGGLRRVVVPPDLAYGAAGRPPVIPSNATLVFDVELTAVQ